MDRAELPMGCHMHSGLQSLACVSRPPWRLQALVLPCGPEGDGLEELASGGAAHLRIEVATPRLPFFFLYMYPIL